MCRPLPLSTVMYGFFLAFGLLAGPSGAIPTADAAPVGKLQNGTDRAGCSPSDARIFRAECAQANRAVSALGPSAACQDAPRGFSLFGPPRPFGPEVRLCW